MYPAGGGRRLFLWGGGRLFSRLIPDAERGRHRMSRCERPCQITKHKTRARFVDNAAGRASIGPVVPAGRLARPEEIGEIIHYLATMEGTFLTGAIIDFSGGWPVALPPPSSSTLAR